MTAPRSEVRAFVERCLPGSRIEALPGDVSSRRFYRIRPSGEGPTRILMDYGEPFSGASDDMLLAELFRRAELPVAGVVETSGSAGCLLLEDLGARTLQSVLAGPVAPPRRRRLLEEAARLAARVARDGTPAFADAPHLADRALDAARFRFEMDYFMEHFVIGFRGRPGPHPDLQEALYALADGVDDPARRVLCHRDYHSRNLMVRADDRLAMVDIQDARPGPDSYDLSSLVRDAYLDISEDERVRLLDVYLESFPATVDRDAFLERQSQVELQRMIKALGTFGCQVTRRGDEGFHEAIARTVSRLRLQLVAAPAAGALQELLLRDGWLDDPS